MPTFVTKFCSYMCASIPLNTENMQRKEVHTVVVILLKNYDYLSFNTREDKTAFLVKKVGIPI